MKKISKSITINAPVEKVYKYIADQETQPEWLPGIVEVSETTEPKVGAQFKWTYQMAGMLFKGEAIVAELVPNKKIRTQSKGGINSDWIWQLEAKNGETKLDLNVEYTVPVPVLGKLAEKIILKKNDREVDLAMQNIKDRMEN